MNSFKFIVAVVGLSGSITNVFTSADGYSVELAEATAINQVANAYQMSISDILSVVRR